MPRAIHLLAFYLIILTGTFVMVAQEDVSPQFLTLNTPTLFELDGKSPAFFYYDGKADETITITLRAISDLDAQLNNPILEIWDIDGKRIAYNDNNPHDENPRNAQLAHIHLLADGDYIIRADTYGGIYAGEFEITIEASDPFGRGENGDEVIFYVPRYAIFSQSVTLDAGDVVTISAQDLSGTLDPFLWITAPDGATIAQNDDHATSDFSLGTLDSRIVELNIPQTGAYTLHVRDFLGHSGDVRLSINKN
jgi:hypothetical protein